MLSRLFFSSSRSLALSRAPGYKTTVSSLPALHALAAEAREVRVNKKRRGTAERRGEERSVFQALLRCSRRRRHGLIEAMLRAGLPGPRDETGELSSLPPFLPPSSPPPPPPLSALHKAFCFDERSGAHGSLPRRDVLFHRHTEAGHYGLRRTTISPIILASRLAH